jgi:hypothetical protein
MPLYRKFVRPNIVIRTMSSVPPSPAAGYFASPSSFAPLEGWKSAEPFCSLTPSRPRPLPLLTAQTPLFYDLHPTPSLIAQEELQGVDRVRRFTRRGTPYSGRRARFADSDGESEQRGEESDGDVLIPKPLGEAGRLSRGGYNLEAAMNWEHQQFEELKVQ